MALIDRAANSCSSPSPKCLPELQPGQHDIHDNNQYDHQRDGQYRTLWRRVQQLVGLERATKWINHRSDNILLSGKSRGTVSIRDYDKGSGYYRNRASSTHSPPRYRNNFAVSLLAVSLLCPAVVHAGGDVNPETNVIANPIATTTGQATNQAVQINQGGYSKQSFSPGHFCNSSTLTVSPFYIGSDVHPMYSRNQNFGIQATVSFPLDGRMVELCKSLAEKRLEKERLDYALVRALKCAELLKKGFMFHPNSQFSVVCSDVVPIVLLPRSDEVSSP